jgi:hypothetical protein
MTTSAFNAPAAPLASDPRLLPDPEFEAERTHWTLDRRVPLAMIIAMFIQFGGFVWWFATLNVTVTSQGDRISRLEMDRTAASQTLSSMQALLARIDERTGYLTDALRQKMDHK